MENINYRIRMSLVLFLSVIIGSIIADSKVDAFVASDFRVNQLTTFPPEEDGAEDPAIAVDSQNHFIVTWEDPRLGDDNVFARIFDSNGTALGDEFRVDQDLVASDPAIAVDNHDHFIITWEETRVTQEPENDDVYARIFDSNGNPLSDAFRVDQAPSTTEASQPAIATDGNSNFIIVWTDDRSGHSDIFTNIHNTEIALADVTPPIIIPTITPTPNAAGWHNTDVTVSWSVSDPESGIATSAGCNPTTIATETAGTSFTCTATNGAGRASSASVTVRIDKTPPTVVCSASPNSLRPPNHKMVPVTVTMTTTDPLSGIAGATTLTSTSSSEADQGLGDGDRPNDIQEFIIGISDTQGLLRAERSGRGTGRVYTLSYGSMDWAGNAGTCSATIVVPHDQRK